jgi:hypothetical protein
MAFAYDPKDANQTLPEGKYSASIVKATQFKDDGTAMRSKGGEAMQCVTFEVYPNDESRPRQLKAYFTAKSTLFRYRKLAQALGKGDEFKAQRFNAEEHIGANVTLMLSIQDHPQYGEQNNIDDFLPMTGPPPMREPTQLPKPAATAGADDIPF